MASLLFVETTALPFFGSRPNEEGFFLTDKIVHFFIFLFLSLVYHRSLLSFYTKRKGFEKLPKTVSISFVLLGIIFAALTEWAQEVLTSTRSGDFYDFLSDVLGLFFYIQFQRFFLPTLAK